jgi:hypothetical protein
VNPKVTGAELVEMQSVREAAKEILKPSKIILSLAGILAKAEASSRAGHPWKNGAVGLRFSYIFKRRPYPGEVAAAEEFNRILRTTAPVAAAMKSA